MNSSDMSCGVGIVYHHRGVSEARRLGFGDRGIRLGDTVPALVAVHRVVAARDGGDRHVSRQRLAAASVCHRAPDRGGVSRPSVKACTTVFTPASCRILASATAWSWCECTPPGETRPIRWQVPPDALSFAISPVSAGARAMLPSCDGLADARQFLHHHAAGADVQVADLGVAHLAVRQPDIAAGGVQEGVRTGLPQPVEIRLPRQTNGVVGDFLAPAEAVEDHQHHRPNRLRHDISSLPQPDTA